MNAMVEKKQDKIRTELVLSVAMLTKEEVAAVLLVSPQQVDKFRLCGLLRGIKTGLGYRYSQEELKAFQNDLAGTDISSEQGMLNAVRLRKFA